MGWKYSKCIACYVLSISEVYTTNRQKLKKELKKRGVEVLNVGTLFGDKV